MARGSKPPRRCACALAAGILAVLVACTPNPPGEAFFPLEHGRWWHYRVERTTMDGVQQLRHAVSARAAPGGSAADAMRETLDGQRFFYRVTEDGIYRVGHQQRAGTTTTITDDIARVVLPHKLEVAQEWRVTDHTSVLENTGPPWETLFRVNVPIEIRYRVTSLSETVETPAGRFDGCLLVTGHGRTNMDVGNYIGHTEIEVTSSEWYAPGVGLVRLEREETTTASALNFGSLLVELADWDAN